MSMQNTACLHVDAVRPALPQPFRFLLSVACFGCRHFYYVRSAFFVPAFEFTQNKGVATLLRDVQVEKLMKRLLVSYFHFIVRWTKKIF